MSFKPQRQLRSSLIKNTLKSFIVSPLVSKYQICGVRSLCSVGCSKEDVWLLRRQLENILIENPRVVCFFSCITAVCNVPAQKRKRKDNESDESTEEETQTSVQTGISFWIAFDWPEYGLSAFENHISREFLSAKLDIVSCKAIRPRGKTEFILLVLTIVQ